MKLILKEKSQVKVGKRMEESYRYESEDGKVIVQFNAGAKAWTWQIGVATNEAGRPLVGAVINEFCRVGVTADRSTPDGFDNAITTLEIK